MFVKLSNQETDGFKSSPRDLVVRIKCLTKGHQHIDLVLNLGPPGSKTIALMPSHRAFIHEEEIQIFYFWTQYREIATISAVDGQTDYSQDVIGLAVGQYYVFSVFATNQVASSNRRSTTITLFAETGMSSSTNGGNNNNYVNDKIDGRIIRRMYTRRLLNKYQNLI